MDGERSRPEEERDEGVGRGDLGDGPGQGDLEIAAGGNLDGPSAEILDEDEERARGGQDDEEQDDQKDGGGSFHGRSSLPVPKF